MAQSDWLALLFLHLTGPAIRARVEVEDLVQETLLRAVSAPSGLPDVHGADSSNGEAALRRLLAHIARNCVMDVLRRMRAQKRAGREVRLVRSDWSATGLGDGRLVAPGAGPATRVAATDEHRSVMAAYERLSPEHRRVLGLRQFEALDARETGRRMGRSETAVHSLYRRALAAWTEAAGGSGAR
jgi:RNA polymerase sigma factor (sigma-70 family)